MSATKWNRACDRSFDTRGVDGFPNFPPCVGSLDDTEPKPATNDRLGHAHLEVVEIVALLASDLEDVFEAGCREERRPGALHLDHGVRDQGGAVHDVSDLLGRDCRLPEDQANAFE